MHTVQYFSLGHVCNVQTLQYFARLHIRKCCFLQRLMGLQIPPLEQQTRNAKKAILPVTSVSMCFTSGRQCFKAVRAHPQTRFSVTAQHFSLGDSLGQFGDFCPSAGKRERELLDLLLEHFRLLPGGRVGEMS